METLLENVEELVQDHDEVVTYKELMLKFKLNANVAKQCVQRH
mgnify:CR=1 FL=1